MFAGRTDECIGAAAERCEKNLLIEAAIAESVLRKIKNAVQLRGERRAVNERWPISLRHETAQFGGTISVPVQNRVGGEK